MYWSHAKQKLQLAFGLLVGYLVQETDRRGNFVGPPRYLGGYYEKARRLFPAIWVLSSPDQNGPGRRFRDRDRRSGLSGNRFDRRPGIAGQLSSTGRRGRG